jgi:hypothetical protein
MLEVKSLSSSAVSMRDAEATLGLLPKRFLRGVFVEIMILSVFGVGRYRLMLACPCRGVRGTGGTPVFSILAPGSSLAVRKKSHCSFP